MSQPNDPYPGPGPDFAQSNQYPGYPHGGQEYPPQSQYTNQQYGQPGKYEQYGQGYGEEPPRGGGAVKWVAIIAAIVLVIGGAVGAFLWFGGDEEEPTAQPSATQPAEEPSDEPSEEPSEEPSADEPSEDPSSEEPAEEPTSEEPAASESPSADTPSESPSEDPEAGDGMVNVPQQVGEWKFFGSETGASYHHQQTRATVILDLEGDAQVEVFKEALTEITEFDGGFCGSSDTDSSRCFVVNSSSPEGEHIALFSSQATLEEIVPLAEAIAQH